MAMVVPAGSERCAVRSSRTRGAVIRPTVFWRVTSPQLPTRADRPAGEPKTSRPLTVPFPWIPVTAWAVTAPPNSDTDVRETRAVLQAEPLANEASNRTIGAFTG